MSWRLKVVHRTGLRYASPVSVSFNEVRMTPSSGEGQLLITHELSVTPRARVQTYTDYWGTTVEAFDVNQSHTVLEVIATSLVDTGVPQSSVDDMSWEELLAPSTVDRWCEFLTFTSYVDDASHDSARVEVVEHARALATPTEALNFIVPTVQEHLQYSSGSTTVSTTASEAWSQAQGVCQDFTHITLSLLRSCGIPARYVSGYLYKGDGEVGETVVGESHAWVEAWLGSWHPVDPTNGSTVSEAHIVVARGRDYSDVSPLKGIYAGGQSEALGVEVSLTRLPR
jgi:transglutaminase-like putative cysteine protease